jgi:hypothetical protein
MTGDKMKNKAPIHWGFFIVFPIVSSAQRGDALIKATLPRVSDDYFPHHRLWR